MNTSIRTQVMAMASELEDRGTRLRPAADPITLAELEASVGGSLSNEARTMFSIFDGFEAHMADDPTMVSLWSISSIKAHLLDHGQGRKGQIFADYFLSAELFCCDLTKENSAVWWNERGTRAANSLSEFLSKIAQKTIIP